MISIDARWVNTSGIGTYLRHVLPGLINHFADRTFVLLGNEEELSKCGWSEARNVEICDFRAPMYSVQEQWQLARLIPKKTMLHFATHYPIPLLYRGPLLVTVYDLFHLAMPTVAGGLHKRAYASYMFRSVRKRADAIITISNFTKQEFFRLVGAGAQQIHPIHLGVDDDWFRIPNEKPASAPEPYIVFVGNVKPHKNLSTLIQAFSLLQKHIPHRLLIIGKREGFITGARFSPGLMDATGSRVSFTGPVSDHLLKQYVAHADAMVFPSLYEGFGLPPLEAMAAGCPALASRAAPIPQICGYAPMSFHPHSAHALPHKSHSFLPTPNLLQ